MQTGGGSPAGALHRRRHSSGRSLAPVTSVSVVVTDGDSARSVRRPATSFKVRRRSLSPKRQAEFDEWIREWGLDLDGPVLDWSEVFGRDR